ncbi:hypothetical protein Acr_07g0013090 [Actinidia rufa]|uniref:Uncharacterized protein n=1 Tax=Actinidia rufa TaxID=165716 RepID=A0A7J0EXJ6_9ERIC|nr:hypothetical protein Acr_07g0013090 [Actinidia rufa]
MDAMLVASATEYIARGAVPCLWVGTVVTSQTHRLFKGTTVVNIPITMFYCCTARESLSVVPEEHEWQHGPFGGQVIIFGPRLKSAHLRGAGTSARRGRADYEGKGKGKESLPSHPRKKARRGDLSPFLEHEDATPVLAPASTEDIDLGDDDNVVQPERCTRKYCMKVSISSPYSSPSSDSDASDSGSGASENTATIPVIPEEGDAGAPIAEDAMMLEPRGLKAANSANL